MKITCFIRYQIDPVQRQEFRKYVETGAGSCPAVARVCGGNFNKLSKDVLAFVAHVPRKFLMIGQIEWS
jgi:hypothetical protein